MQLAELKPQWSDLSDEEKIALIERTNERRLAAFEVKTKRKTSKRSKSSSKKTVGRKRAPKDPAKLAQHVNKTMTKEQRENFLLMLQMQQDN